MLRLKDLKLHFAKEYPIVHFITLFFPFCCSCRLLWSMQRLTIKLSLCNSGYSVLLCQEIIESFYKVHFVSGSFFFNMKLRVGVDLTRCHACK